MITPITATKKPVRVQATNWDGGLSEAGEVIEWISQNGGTASFKETNETEHRNHAEIHIHTLEGVMAASPGDWIIMGLMGEFYPCRSDIFDATYNYI